MRHAGGDSACEVPGAGAGVHGAVPPRVGGHRSPGDRPRGQCVGGAGHGDGRVDDSVRAARSAGASPLAALAQRRAGGGRKGQPSPTRPSCGTCTCWWSPRRPAILIPRFGGRAGACGRWPWRWTGWAITSVKRWSRSCCTPSATASKAHVKSREGRQHPDRDAQFRYIAQVVRRWQRQRQPTISVDTKKKELVGDFKMAGASGAQRRRPSGSAFTIS